MDPNQETIESDKPKKRGRFARAAGGAKDFVGNFSENHKVATAVLAGTTSAAAGVALAEPLANGAKSVAGAVGGVFSKAPEAAMDTGADLVDAVISSDETQDAAFNGVASLAKMALEAVISR